MSGAVWEQQMTLELTEDSPVVSATAVGVARRGGVPRTTCSEDFAQLRSFALPVVLRATTSSTIHGWCENAKRVSSPSLGSVCHR